MTTRSTAWLIPVALGCLVAGGATAQNAVGQVTSVVGKVLADRPGAENRALACGDTVYAGDTVTTGLGSSAGIVMDDVLARVDGASAVKFDLTPDGTPYCWGDLSDGSVPNDPTAVSLPVVVEGITLQLVSSGANQVLPMSTTSTTRPSQSSSRLLGSPSRNSSSSPVFLGR